MENHVEFLTENERLITPKEIYKKEIENDGEKQE